jgi:hypothetical protein
MGGIKLDTGHTPVSTGDTTWVADDNGVNSNGNNIGINGDSSATSELKVTGDIESTGNVGVGAPPDADSEFYVAGDIENTGKTGLGGAPDGSYTTKITGLNGLLVTGNSRLAKLGVAAAPDVTYQAYVEGANAIKIKDDAAKFAIHNDADAETGFITILSALFSRINMNLYEVGVSLSINSGAVIKPSSIVDLACVIVAAKKWTWRKADTTEIFNFHDTGEFEIKSPDYGGAFSRKLYAASSGALSGATGSIAVNVPSGAIIRGVLLINSVLIEGATSYDADFDANAGSTAIAATIGLPQNTQTKKAYVGIETTGVATIDLTANGPNFSAGTVIAVVIADVLTDLDTF